VFDDPVLDDVASAVEPFGGKDVEVGLSEVDIRALRKAMKKA
jgi:hypothetical protein